MTDYDVIIVGGGPAGSSAAIRCAANGIRVVLLEEKHMPREKVCGEFITPECFPTLERAGVVDRLLSQGARKITKLGLVASTGKSIESEISRLSDVETWAMSLSRSRFDQVLLERARELGADCREGVAVKKCINGAGGAIGVEAMLLPEGRTATFRAPIVIDASGRGSRLTATREERVAGRRGSRLYGLKAHLADVEGICDQVELYFFPQGYGGLSLVEGGLANLCFIAGEGAFAQAGGDPIKIVEETIKKNKLARERLRRARIVGAWHSTGPLSFGKRALARGGVLTVGDASGMIDPFTGTGIQIALRTGELAAQAVCERMGSGRHRGHLFADALAQYSAAYEAEFAGRMRVARLLRITALSPRLTNMSARLLSRAPGTARRVLKATRGGLSKA
ncbi:MAG TPA: NAD(P)/FAD-dependent oxidoreductase [Blastocatellia bacterium]|jgi:geranylgeranyl reductase family protein